MDKEIIYCLLKKANECFENIPLYLSSDIGKTKASGNLFRYLHDEFYLSYNQWIHIGDNHNSDNDIPRKLGIKTIHLCNHHLISIEKAMIAKVEDDVSLQFLVGLSKNTRIIHQLKGTEVVGASLSGFLLGSYIKWILHDALNKGIKTLYFVARDGYILKQVADIFIKEMNYNIKTKYIYGSRKAWRMPAQLSSNMSIFEILHVSFPEFLIDLKSVADVLGLSFCELYQFLPPNIDKEDCKLSRQDIDIVFYYLSKSDKFKKYLEKVNEEKKILILKYLKQEIYLQEAQIAFVEVGGTGHTQNCLEYILRDIYKGKVMTYFFNLYSVKETEGHLFYNFIPDELYIHDAIEPLCRAPHGQTLGYIQKENQIEPILEKEEIELFNKCGYYEYIQGFLAYANTYMNYYKDIFQMPTNKKLIKMAWNYYTHVKDNNILDFVGEVPFEVVGKENKNSRYAPKLTLQEIKDIFYFYRSDPVSWHYNGDSLIMSILRMNREEKNLMKKYLRDERCKKSLKDNNQFENSQHSFIKIPQNKYTTEQKIVIYGAGSVGKAFYYQASQEKYNIVLWVDKQYHNYQKEGYPVSNPEELLIKEFNIIIIAVLDEIVKDNIKNNLLYMGIPEEIIDWITPEELLKGYNNK